MEVAIIIIVFFFLCILAYAWLAVFYPEWVGITGNKAREIEASHRSTADEVEQHQGTPKP